MAMGAVKGQGSTLQVAMVCLDELVPEDCRYRRLDRLVDWSFVREAAGPYYAEDVGRPSIDPIVLVKLMVAAALEGIGSTRELCRVAGLRLDLRRFLGYGFHERLPVHQTLSHAQTRRFVDGVLFERLFLRSLDLCKQHGLVEGSHLSVDGFHAEANAALASLRASLALVAVEESGEAEPPPLSGPPQLSLAEPRSGRTPKRRSSNRTSVSRTDPDAKLPASRASGRTSSSGVRWRSTRRRAAWLPVSVRRRAATRVTGSSRSSTGPASPVPNSPRSAPTPASRPSGSGGVWSGAAWSPTSRRSRRCCPKRASPKATPSGRPWPPAGAARASAA